MNLETKITIYKFTPQLFTLTPCFWHGNIGVLDWLDCIDEMARLLFPMVIWRHGFYVSILCRGIVATAKMATGGL